MKTKNDIHVKLWAGIGIDTWYHSLSIVLQHILPPAQGRIRYRAGHRHAIRKFLLVHSRSSQGSQLLIAAIVAWVCMCACLALASSYIPCVDWGCLTFFHGMAWRTNVRTGSTWCAYRREEKKDPTATTEQ